MNECVAAAAGAHFPVRLLGDVHEVDAPVEGLSVGDRWHIHRHRQQLRGRSVRRIEHFHTLVGASEPGVRIGAEDLARPRIHETVGDGLAPVLIIVVPARAG